MQWDPVWSWSEAFAEIVDGLMRDPLLERAAQRDWPKHRDRLEWWSSQVESARELYRLGEEQALRALYDYWRTIADDVKEQARFASETYRELRFRARA